MKLCYKPVGGAGVYLFYPGEKNRTPWKRSCITFLLDQVSEERINLLLKEGLEDFSLAHQVILSFPVPKENGWNISDGSSLTETMFDYGDNGFLAIPVKDRLLLQYAEDSGLLPGTLASFQGALDRIDSAKVYSDLDLDIYNLYETWHFERPEESLEELVDRTVSTMEMTLAE